MKTTSQKGIDFIKFKYEQTKFNDEGMHIPFLCPAKVPTIGWGNTFYQDRKKVTLKDKPITKDEANQLFDWYIKKYCEEPINKIAKIELKQNEFDALVSFGYNLGENSLKKIMAVINLGDKKASANKFLEFVWCRIDGKYIKSNGLIARRNAEIRIFNDCKYS